MTPAERLEAKRKIAAMLAAARQAISAGGGPRDAYLAASVARWLEAKP